MSMKVPPNPIPSLHRLSSISQNNLKQMSNSSVSKKQTAFETLPEDWRNSEQGYRLKYDTVLLEDLRDALKTVRHQVHNLFTPET